MTYTAPDHRAILDRWARRPDLLQLAGKIEWRVDSNLSTSFALETAHRVALSPSAFRCEGLCAVTMRHALELLWLTSELPNRPVLASLAAARVAARFCHLEASADPGSWQDELEIFGAALAPSDSQFTSAWSKLRGHLPECRTPFDPREAQIVRDHWDNLGPVEALMESGGDVRLRVDARYGLNAYGCSHRPRPWAVSFASSTASSVSERGFSGAEAARRAVTLSLLAGRFEEGLAETAQAVKTGIAGYFGLRQDIAVILAGSGTDCELFTLALAQMKPRARTIDNILVAPEETGSGVPLAACGRHFAVNTAWNIAVEKGTAIEGFDTETNLISVPLREKDGRIRAVRDIDAQCEAALRDALAGGRDVLLHILDASKTGALAPSLPWAKQFIAAHPQVDVVVDACQARLDPASVRDYLDQGWMVQVTGSKFFTGPPFSGAILIPASIAARLETRSLPAGIGDYAGRHEWPDHARCDRPFAGQANLGLLLRWHAAIAEMQAFAAVPPARRREILGEFGQRISTAIQANQDLAYVAPPAIHRSEAGDGWDEFPTILTFGIRRRDGAGCLDPEAARAVYRWLNADLAPILPAYRDLASLRCHIGQPVALIDENRRSFGALRISAGARLVSGEPSHAGLDETARLEHEFSTIEQILAKISLILDHADLLQDHDPPPTYR